MGLRTPQVNVAYDMGLCPKRARTPAPDSYIYLCKHGDANNRIRQRECGPYILIQSDTNPCTKPKGKVKEKVRAEDRGDCPGVSGRPTQRDAQPERDCHHAIPVDEKD